MKGRQSCAEKIWKAKTTKARIIADSGFLNSGGTDVRLI